MGWFVGLSRAFLSVRGAKMLLVADTNRLDTPLTIAQMQGSYQFKVRQLKGCPLPSSHPVRRGLLILIFLQINPPRHRRACLPSQILAGCGHCLHEDAPDQAAEALVAYAECNGF